MTFMKGDYVIAVEKIDVFGKRHSLWVGKGNSYFKVASFSNERAAKRFEQFLKYFVINEPMPDNVLRPDWEVGK